MAFPRVVVSVLAMVLIAFSEGPPLDHCYIPLGLLIRPDERGNPACRSEEAELGCRIVLNDLGLDSLE
jgi:hypothetical protein